MLYFKYNYLQNMEGCSVLDVGSRIVVKGHNSYRKIFEPEFNYVGMDVEHGENVDIVGFEALKKYPKFKVLISGQTMEHVNRPWEWLKSLVPFFSDYICIIAPWSLHEHRYPIDTYRYMPDGMRDLFDYAGIKEIQIFKSRKDTIGIGTKK